jgi:hypothetical protein
MVPGSEENMIKPGWFYLWALLIAAALLSAAGCRGTEPAPSQTPIAAALEAAPTPLDASPTGSGTPSLQALRQKAVQRLGERFDPDDFQQAVDQKENLPPAELEQAVDAYITLASLEVVSDFPLYVMRYEGDYGFSAFLEAAREEGSPQVELPAPPPDAWACTGFAGSSPEGEIVFGRNFDWHRHPALLLFTHPPDGFASVSMVDIAYLGYTQHVADWQDRQALLEAPYLPFDGMNSADLAVGMMAVHAADSGADPAKPTLDELQVIRLLLDRAASVAEALDLLSSVNIDFSGGPPLHYLIADASGKSAVVEFVGGEMRSIPNTSAWQVSTNFLISEEQPQDADSSCWRYNRAYTTLEQSGGRLSDEAATTLLEEVAQGGDYPTIWSVVYNLTAKTIRLVVGREYGQVFSYALGNR